MDKYYTMLSILLYGYAKNKDYVRVFVIELISDEGLKAYAFFRYKDGASYSIHVGDRREWYDDHECNIYDNLELAVRDYCNETIINFDKVYPSLYATLNLSGFVVELESRECGVKSDLAAVLEHMRPIAKEMFIDSYIKIYLSHAQYGPMGPPGPVDGTEWGKA